MRKLETHREGDWNCPELLGLKCADLYVVKSRHKIGSNLSSLLFGYGVRRILFTGFKHVLKCSAILGSASVSKQLN